MVVDIKHMKSLTLAYVGDAVYELYVREHLIKTGVVKPHDLHRKAVSYVSAPAQAFIILKMIEVAFLSEGEQSVVRRGRNAKSATIPKNISVQAYRYSTGFESLIGYLHFSKDQSRLEEVIIKAINIIEEGKES